MDYLIEGSYDRVMYSREASQVQRCHGLPHIGSYDIAQHSFNMLLLLKQLHPSAQRQKRLFWAITAHDMGERVAGDVPAPVKVRDPIIKEQLDKIEDLILVGTGFNTENLSDTEHKWLKGLDLLEFWFWISEQVTMGNGRLRNEKAQVEEVLHECKSWLPAPIYSMFVKAVTTDYRGVGNKGWKS